MTIYNAFAHIKFAVRVSNTECITTCIITSKVLLYGIFMPLNIVARADTINVRPGKIINYFY